MVKHRFRFKRRGGSGHVTIEIDEKGVMSLPETSFKNPSDTCSTIARIVRTMLSENWIDVDVKEMS